MILTCQLHTDKVSETTNKCKDEVQRNHNYFPNKFPKTLHKQVCGMVIELDAYNGQKQKHFTRTELGQEPLIPHIRQWLDGDHVRVEPNTAVPRQ